MAKRNRRVPRYLRGSEAKTHPDVPAGCIPADLSQQAPNNSYGPPTFYRDYEFSCVDCGSREIWTAEQQKWWYEVAKGSIYSGAKRCRACRAAHRQAHRGTPRRSHLRRSQPDAEG
ncbi:MAG: zinc-ribbon domain containing protein [Isosphaeraceae bacterium]